MPDFNALQNAFDRGAAPRRSSTSCSTCPFFEGYDLREVPLRERRRLLQAAARRQGQRARALQRRLRRPTPASILAVGLPHGARRRHRQARRCALRVAAHRDLAEAEVQAAPGVRRRRLHRPQPAATAAGRQPAARRARRRRQAGLRRQRRHRLGRETGARAASQADSHRDRSSRRSRPAIRPSRGRWSQARRRQPSAGSSPSWWPRSTFAEWTPDGQIRHASYHGPAHRQAGPQIVTARRPAAIGFAGAAAVAGPSRDAQDRRRRHQGQQRRARDRPEHRPHQARPGALLRDRSPTGSCRT